MRKMLLLIIWLSSVRCQQPEIHVSAQEGGLAEISCPYDSGYETYPKYFYKGIYGHNQIVINTAAGKKGSTQEGKYDFCDDTKQRRLRVTIHNVNLNDAGTYWCEIHAYGFDRTTEIELKVYRGNKLYVPVAVAAAVLLLMGFFYCWLKKHTHDTGSSFGGEAAPWINTWSTVLYVKSQNICSIRSPYTEAGDPHISEDGRLLYSTVCFHVTDQPTPSHPQVVKHRHLSHAHK